MERAGPRRTCTAARCSKFHGVLLLLAFALALPSASAGSQPTVVRSDVELLAGLRAGATELLLPCSASIQLGRAWERLENPIEREAEAGDLGGGAGRLPYRVQRGGARTRIA
jgi:hypothetical protein